MELTSSNFGKLTSTRPRWTVNALKKYKQAAAAVALHGTQSSLLLFAPRPYPQLSKQNDDRTWFHERIALQQ
jgi:hypothetical protein